MSAHMPRPKWWVHWVDREGNPHSDQFDHYVGDPAYGVEGAWDLEHKLLPLWLRKQLPACPILTAQPINPTLGEGPRFEGPAGKKKRAAQQATLGMEGGDLATLDAPD